MYSAFVKSMLIDIPEYVFDFLDGKDKVLFYDLFPPTYYSIMCKNKTLITGFDSGMEKLCSSGELNKIISRNININIK